MSSVRRKNEEKMEMVEEGLPDSEGRERIVADILVVDDDPRICRSLAHYLGREGYGVRTALNGKEMRRRVTEKPPDLVILDLILPDEDGLTLARELRARSDVPIIILTAKFGAADEFAELEFGAADYITKPFDEQTLLARVHSLLRRMPQQEHVSQHPEGETQPGSQGFVGRAAQLLPADSQELSRSLEEQRGLNRILRAIQDAQTPTQVLEIAVDHVLQVSWLGMQASAAAFLVRGQQLHKVVSRNLPPAVDVGCAQVVLGQCLCGRVAETGKPIVCAHVNECALEDKRHDHAEGMVDHGHVILPLKWKSQVQGVLCFYLPAGDKLGDRRSNFLESVAAILATTIGRLNYQSQLAQSDRLSSVGLLAAGVAHEIRNPLGLVLGNVEWLEEDLPPLLEQCRDLRKRLFEELGAEHATALLSGVPGLRNDKLLNDMAQCTRSALDGVRRVRSIVGDLGTFSRADDNQLSEVSLADVLKCAITLAHNEIKYRARLTRDFKQTPPVLANEGRLSQVFLNLLVNAAHAIDEGDYENNEIRVRLWHEGEEVIAEVKDTGKGIAPADLPYVFEPFFTTKEKGVGTGLGLYISNNIITAVGGHIDVESTVGRGTRFAVHLPAVAPNH